MTEAPRSYPVTELLPCPFCGSSDLWDRDWRGPDDDDGYYEIACKQCSGATDRFCGVHGSNREESVTAWNTRPIGVAQRPQVSPLSKRLYALSEPHLSGYRLVLGFETLADSQAAHEAIALSSTARYTCAAIVNPNIPHARSCPLSSTQEKTPVPATNVKNFKAGEFPQSMVNALKASKMSSNHQSLDQLLDGMTDENRHEELPVSPLYSPDICLLCNRPLGEHSLDTADICNGFIGGSK